MRGKKGAMGLSDLAPIAIAFVFVAVVLTVGADVLADVQSGQGVGVVSACGLNSTGGTGGTLLWTGCGFDYNATTSGLNSLQELTGWLPTIALVVAAAIVIGVLAFFRK